MKNAAALVAGSHLGGGSGTAWQRRMVQSLQQTYPINIVLDLHGQRLRPDSGLLKRISLSGGT